MMRIQIDINSRKIGDIAVHNTGKKQDSEEIYGVYDVHPIENTETFSDAEKLGSINHRRESGAASLVSKVFNEVITEECLQ